MYILVVKLDDEGRGVRLGGEGRRDLGVDPVVGEGGERGVGGEGRGGGELGQSGR